MTVSSGIRSWWDSVLEIGTYPGETDIHRGKRCIAVGYFVIGALTRWIATVAEFSDGSIAAWVDLTAALASMALLFVLWRKPLWFIGIVNVALFFVLVKVLSATVLLGGLVPSEMIILFGIIAVVGALIMLRVRDAFLWLSPT